MIRVAILTAGRLHNGMIPGDYLGMKRRPPRQPSAEQMIRAYLGQVSTAATRKLPKGDRLLFVGRTRAAIEAQVGPLASADPEDVVAALTALGDPDELAAKERERLQRARRRGSAAQPTLWKPPGKTSRRDAARRDAARRAAARDTPGRDATGEARAPAKPPRRSRTWPYRRSGADEPARPSSAEPEPRAAAPGLGAQIPQPRRPDEPGPSAGAPGAVPAPPGSRPGNTGAGPGAGLADWLASSAVVGPGMPNGTAGPGTRNGTHPGPQHADTGPAAQNGTGPGAVNGTSRGTRAGGTEAEPPGPSGAAAPDAGDAGDAGDAADQPSGPGRPRREAPADGTKPLSIVPGMDTPDDAEEEPAGRRFGPPVPLTEAWALARNNPLETVSVVLLGIGGLIYPFPVWLLGALVALRSRRWDKRDKWLGLVGPPGFAVVCMLLLGITGSGGFFHALATASHQFSLLLRVGCVLCAGYLVWRLRRGPRRRRPPPWLRMR